MSALAKADVKRPAFLAAAVVVLGAAAAALAGGLYAAAARHAERPAVVAIDKQSLDEALDDAPWVSSNEDAASAPAQAEDDGQDEESRPVLWYVAEPDCTKCRAFERTSLARLLDEGVEVHAVLVAPRNLAPDSGAARDVAQLTKEHDWTGLYLWMQGKRPERSAPMDPAEEDGLLEWGRQSAERLRALLQRNDLPFSEPALFWKKGPEWRASFSGNSAAVRELEQDLAPKA